MGAVRTTFAMVAALIVRRKQLVERGFADPFGLTPPSAPLNGTPVISGTSTPASNNGTPNGIVSVSFILIFFFLKARSDT